MSTAELPPPPAALAELFPEDRVELALRYAACLAGDGVVRGLIGPRETPRLWQRHVLNCALLAPALPASCTVADVGSGAGLPGLVLAIARPDVTITLIEPLLRRTTFLEEVAADLGLVNVYVVRARADALHGKETFDIVTSRAVAPLDRLLEWSMPLVAPTGALSAMKGASVDTELDAAVAGSASYGILALLERDPTAQVIGLFDLLAMLARTEVLDEPFTHCYLEQVFPESLYDDLLAARVHTGVGLVLDAEGDRDLRVGGADAEAGARARDRTVRDPVGHVGGAARLRAHHGDREPRRLAARRVDDGAPAAEPALRALGRGVRDPAPLRRHRVARRLAAPRLPPRRRVRVARHPGERPGRPRRGPTAPAGAPRDSRAAPGASWCSPPERR